MCRWKGVGNEMLMQLIMRILAFVFLVPGFATVFAARWAVERFNLAQNMKVDFEHEMSEDEVKEYKYNKAIVNLKMLGMLIALPGLILVIIAFR